MVCGLRIRFRNVYRRIFLSEGACRLLMKNGWVFVAKLSKRKFLGLARVSGSSCDGVWVNIELYRVILSTPSWGILYDSLFSL